MDLRWFLIVFTVVASVLLATHHIWYEYMKPQPRKAIFQCHHGIVAYEYHQHWLIQYYFLPSIERRINKRLAELLPDADLESLEDVLGIRILSVQLTPKKPATKVVSDQWL